MPLKKLAKQRSTLFLIDGMAIAYRSYFAFIQRPLMNSRGENTSAIYGFVTFLNKILDDENPDFIAVAMDTSVPTFRHREFKDYKATRQKMPEDMAAQLDTLKEVVRAYGIPVIEVDGYEADDIMGTLARTAEKEDVETFLVTSDKDFMQLVSPSISIYKPGRQGTDVEIVSFDGVRKKFGVPPEQVTDVLGLTGDSSDNVPGVPGIGEKTAIPLIQKFGSIENLLAHIDELPQKGLQTKLRANSDKAILSKRLVTIETAVPVPLDFHELKRGPGDDDKLLKLFDDLDFRALARKLRSTNDLPEATSPVLEVKPLTSIRVDEHSYTLVSTEQQLTSLIPRFESAESMVVDTETTSTDPFDAELVGVALCMKEREAFYVPVAPPSQENTDLFGTPIHPGHTDRSHGLPVEFVLSNLKPILENSAVRKIGQNIKYDSIVFSQYGIDVRGVEFDTMVASYLLHEDGQHNLDSLAREFLSYSMISYDDLTGTGKQRINLRDVPLKTVADYSCEDADMTFRLAPILRAKIDQEGMKALADDIEFPLVGVLTGMELAGVAIDKEFLGQMSKELERILTNLTADIHRHAGGPFNINSTQQLGEILFTRLKLAPQRKTKTGLSTDVAVLEALRHEHPMVEQLLEYRQLSKLKSTYVDALPLLLHKNTGRVHTSFNQTVAATGRLSSSDPNLQNIPIRTDIGRSIRQAFIPRNANNRILSADYSQIELRMMAHISGDQGLRQAFIDGEDIHATTAAKIFGVDQGDVTRDMRRKAKEVNFGIMYGIGPFGLSRRLEISQTEAKDIIERYFERFPGVKEYIHSTIEQARSEGYVSTIMGRRRYLPDIRSRNGNLRSNAERQAINMPIQGSSADMIKSAMVALSRSLLKSRLTGRMVLQVHDELVFDIPKGEEEKTRELVAKEMKAALNLAVPVQVEVGVGRNWLEAH